MYSNRGSCKNRAQKLITAIERRARRENERNDTEPEQQQRTKIQIKDPKKNLHGKTENEIE